MPTQILSINIDKEIFENRQLVFSVQCLYCTRGWEWQLRPDDVIPCHMLKRATGKKLMTKSKLLLSFLQMSLFFYCWLLNKISPSSYNVLEVPNDRFKLKKRSTYNRKYFGAFYMEWKFLQQSNDISVPSKLGSGKSQINHEYCKKIITAIKTKTCRWIQNLK